MTGTGSTDTALVEEALGAVLRTDDDAAAWAGLVRDGWLEVLPEDDGGWPAAEDAAAVAGVVARAGRPLPVGAHLAAAAALVRAAAAPAAHDRLGVATDLRADGERLTGRSWTPAAPDLVVLRTADGSLAVARGTDCVVAADPMPSSDDVDVRLLTVPTAAVEAIGDSAAGDRHDAVVAWLLAVEALVPVQDVVRRALAYLGEREAFGQPLASFQALAHRAVEMHTVGLLGGTLLELAGTARSGDGGGAAASWRAKVFAGTRGVWAAEESIQLHGGIGFTWELGVHQALRRAQRARQLLGGTVRAAAEVVAATPAGPRPGLVDWALRPVPRHG